MRKLLLLLLLFVFVPKIVLTTTVSNDPFFTQWAYKDIGLFGAWDYTTGSDEVVVAILDNGFDTFHPDLRDNVWKNEDEIPNNHKDDDKNGYIDDVWGWNFLEDNNDPRVLIDDLSDEERESNIFSHATVVAGLIGARGNNELDGVGMNWQIKMMNVKVLGNSGSGSYENFSTAIHYAVDNGADVINISIVSSLLDKGVTEAIKYAFENGVVVVTAAGNDSTDLNKKPYYPICSDINEDFLVFGVNAVTEDHHLANFSNFGSNCIDFTAPGKGLSSTLRFSPTNGLNKRYGGNWNGTSFAAPLISGTVALIKSVQPTWGPKEIFFAITSTVHHTPSQNEAVYANLFGAGLLQIDKAVKYAFEKLSFSQVINNILSFDSGTGNVENKNLKDSNLKFAINEKLKNISDVESFLDKSELKFITVSESVGNKSVLAIYNKDWQIISSWEVVSFGFLDLAVGDVRGDSKKEIILSPRYNDTQVYRIFDLTGKELDQFTIEGKHKGINIDLVREKVSEKQKIVVIYDFNGLSLNIINEQNKIIQEWKINDVNSVGDFKIGDIDGDKEMEYVIMSGAGEIPYLLYFETDGKLKNKFMAYDPSYRGGADLKIGDYNFDGLDDIIVQPLDNNQSTRVWSGKVKKIAEWSTFAGQSVKNTRILVY
ncbi:MAG: S8 family serine peptidase [Candidatus Magasanikiibacteriota bacterium]